MNIIMLLWWSLCHGNPVVPSRWQATKSVIVVVLFLMTLTFAGLPNAVAQLSAQALGDVSSACPSHTYDTSIQSPRFGDASATRPTESAPPVPTSAGLPTSTTGRPHPNFVAAETGTVAGEQATIHGAERLTQAGFDEATVAATKAGRVPKQADGATVYVNEASPGKYDFIVQSSRGVVTAHRGLSFKSVTRLANNYGWDGWSP